VGMMRGGINSSTIGRLFRRLLSAGSDKNDRGKGNDFTHFTTLLKLDISHSYLTYSGIPPEWTDRKWQYICQTTREQ
jgi:hypothetical protein